MQKKLLKQHPTKKANRKQRNRHTHARIHKQQTCARTHARTHTQTTNTCADAHTRTHIHTTPHTHTHVHTHTHTHTHTDYKRALCVKVPVYFPAVSSRAADIFHPSIHEEVVWFVVLVASFSVSTFRECSGSFSRSVPRHCIVCVPFTLTWACIKALF